MWHRAFWSAALLIFLANLAGAEGDKWFRLSSEHFLLFTDTTEAKGRKLLTDLESRIEALAAVVGPLPTRQFPIEIFAFDKDEDYVQAAPRAGQPAQPQSTNIPFGMSRRSDPALDKRAYLLRGPDRIFIVTRDSSPEDIADHVAHALGHVFFERMVVWRPFWLAEGVAEYLRRIGREADKKTYSVEEGFTVAELLTIAPSATYNDNEPGGAFRTLSYRLLRLLSEDKPAVLRDYIVKLRKEHEAKPQIDIDPAAFEDRLKDYVETPVKAGSAAPVIKGGEVTAAAVAIHRGDLMIAADRGSDSAKWYNAESKEARAARAIAIRFTRPPFEASRVLDRASREVPDHGLLQYHFGAMSIESAKDVESQVAALEHAVQLLPKMGRVLAELARVYALTGRASDGLALIERALDLEPEFSDRFYEIRADVNVALNRFDDAHHDIQIADVLPHTTKDEAERISLKVTSVRKAIETIRREAEERRLQELRRQVTAEVARREPPPKPAHPPPPVPEGMISFEIEARSIIEVSDTVFPEYPEDLRKAGTKGIIALNVVVGSAGKVTSATIANSQVPVLNAATIEAVKKWTFKPGTGNRTIKLIITYALQ